MVMEANIPRAYSEVYSFINALGENYIKKIPMKTYNIIKNNRDVNFNPQFQKNQTISSGDLSNEALSLIAALNLQYWCSDPEEKNELKQAYIENTKKEQEKYSYENLFNRRTETVTETETSVNNAETVNNATSMVEYKESIFTKIKNWFKKIFHKN